jgi:Diphosphoinositol pentakisphosphate kinase 2 N-terminal domain
MDKERESSAASSRPRNDDASDVNGENGTMKCEPTGNEDSSLVTNHVLAVGENVSQREQKSAVTASITDTEDAVTGLSAKKKEKEEEAEAEKILGDRVAKDSPLVCSPEKPLPPLVEGSKKKAKNKATPVKVKNKGPTIPAATPRDNDDCGRIRLGICARDKKARSKPMAEILSRLDEDLFCVIFFGDDYLLNQPIESWPVCDALIAFFSKGYPLKKVQEYVKLRQPFILNDLEMQELMLDRRRVYDLLEASGIDVPRHVYLSRDGYRSTGTGDGDGSGDAAVREFDDHIECNGVTIYKPFVEKPVDAEDHNISIYYPTSAGGGCKKLFRKVGNRSSEFYPDINEVRRDGSYIYEGTNSMI